MRRPGNRCQLNRPQPLHRRAASESWLFGEDSATETVRSAAIRIDAYDRRATSGNVVVSVTVVEDAMIHQAIAALEAHNPLNIDERSDEVAEVGAGSTMAPLTGASTTGQEFSTGRFSASPHGRYGDPERESRHRGGVPETAPAIPSGQNRTGSGGG